MLTQARHKLCFCACCCYLQCIVVCYLTHETTCSRLYTNRHTNNNLRLGLLTNSPRRTLRLSQCSRFDELFVVLSPALRIIFTEFSLSFGPLDDASNAIFVITYVQMFIDRLLNTSYKTLVSKRVKQKPKQKHENSALEIYDLLRGPSPSTQLVYKKFLEIFRQQLQVKLIIF